MGCAGWASFQSSFLSLFLQLQLRIPMQISRSLAPSPESTTFEPSRTKANGQRDKDSDKQVSFFSSNRSSPLLAMKNSSVFVSEDEERA